MPIISPNVMWTAGEVLASHHIQPRPGERLSDAVARALGLSDEPTLLSPRSGSYSPYTSRVLALGFRAQPGGAVPGRVPV